MLGPCAPDRAVRVPQGDGRASTAMPGPPGSPGVAWALQRGPLEAWAQPGTGAGRRARLAERARSDRSPAMPPALRGTAAGHRGAAAGPLRAAAAAGDALVSGSGGGAARRCRLERAPKGTFRRAREPAGGGSGARPVPARAVLPGGGGAALPCGGAGRRLVAVADGRRSARQGGAAAGGGTAVAHMARVGSCGDTDSARGGGPGAATAGGPGSGQAGRDVQARPAALRQGAAWAKGSAEGRGGGGMVRACCRGHRRMRTMPRSKPAPCPGASLVLRQRKRRRCRLRAGTSCGRWPGRCCTTGPGRADGGQAPRMARRPRVGARLVGRVGRPRLRMSQGRRGRLPGGGLSGPCQRSDEPLGSEPVNVSAVLPSGMHGKRVGTRPDRHAGHGRVLWR